MLWYEGRGVLTSYYLFIFFCKKNLILQSININFQLYLIFLNAKYQKEKKKEKISIAF